MNSFKKRSLIGVFVVLGLSPLWLWLLTRGGPEQETKQTKPHPVAKYAFPTRPELIEDRVVVHSDPIVEDSKEPSATSVARLTLEFYDEQSGDLIPSLPYFAYSEVSRDFRFRSISDEQGRGVVENPPSDQIIVLLTERCLPYAPTQSAVWLGQRSGVVVRIPVHRGVRVKGRVVDTDGAPVAGAKIFWQWPYGSTNKMTLLDKRGMEVTVTNELGEYQADAVTSLQEGIWVIDGVPWSERIKGVQLKAYSGGALSGSKSVQIEEASASVALVPDIILPAECSIRGTVIETDGRPVAKALVSFNHDRMSCRLNTASWGDGDIANQSPSQSGFSLLDSEVLTDTAGAFRLVTRRAQRGGLVWAADGRQKVIETNHPWRPIEEVRAKLESEDLVVELLNEKVVTFELLSSTGQRLGRDDFPKRSGRIGSWRRFGLGPGAVRVTAIDSVGTLCLRKALPDSSGLYHAGIAFEKEAIRELIFDVRGFAPYAIQLPSGLQEDLLKVTPKKPPTSRLSYRFHIDGVPPVKPNVKHWLSINAYSSDPSEPSEVGGNFRLETQSLLLTSGAHEGELIVPKIREAWVFVEGPFETWDGRESPLILGPCNSEEIIEIPELVFRKQEDRADVRPSLESRLARYVSKAALPFYLQLMMRQPGTIRAQLVDGSNEKVPVQRRVKVLAIPDDMGESHRTALDRWIQNENGVLESDKVPSGAWDLVLRVRGYEDFEIRDVLVEPGQVNDLGVIRLNPKGTWQGPIRDWKGGNLIAFPYSPNEIDENGRFTVIDPRGPLTLLAMERQSYGSRGLWERNVLSQLEVDTRVVPSGSILDIPKYRDVEIRLTGIPGENWAHEWELHLVNEKGNRLTSAEYLAPLDERTERYRFRLGAGDYSLEGSNGVKKLEGIELRVMDEPGLQIRTIAVPLQ